MLDEHFARFVIGPLGSGKSTGMFMELLRRAVEQDPDENGVRPTRFAVVRNTLQQLRQTCLADMRQIIQPLFEYKIYESTCYFKFPLRDGTIVDSEWLMMPIDTVEDVRRLLSLQLTGAWVSEFREVPYGVLAPLMGRLGRYPSGMRVSPTWQGLIAESNPFSEGSEYYDNLVLKLPSEWAFFRQPGGLDPLAENKGVDPNTGRPILPTNYYERLIQGNDEEWVKVHVHAQFGDDLAGQSVYRKAFNEKIHVTWDPIQVHRGRPLIIAQDLGRTPTCLICQTDVFGRLLILAEITSEDRGLWQFIADLLMPMLVSDRFNGCPVFAVFDPAGAAKSQLREENASDIFRTFNIPCMPASTNDLKQRILALEGLMVGPLRGGNPGLLIDGHNCPKFIQAMKHSYRYRRRKTGDIEDTPEKNHPWSDLADAGQYAALSVQLDLTGRYIQQRVSVPYTGPGFDARAWT